MDPSFSHQQLSLWSKPGFQAPGKLHGTYPAHRNDFRFREAAHQQVMALIKFITRLACIFTQSIQLSNIVLSIGSCDPRQRRA